MSTSPKGLFLAKIITVSVAGWIITNAPWFVPNAVVVRDLEMLSARQQVRNCNVTYRQTLNDHPNKLTKSLF